MPDRRGTFARFDEDITEPTVVAECTFCSVDICAGDEVYRIDDGGGYVHAGTCANAYARERVYDCCGIVQADGSVD